MSSHLNTSRYETPLTILFSPSHLSLPPSSRLSILPPSYLPPSSSFHSPNTLFPSPLTFTLSLHIPLSYLPTYLPFLPTLRRSLSPSSDFPAFLFSSLFRPCLPFFPPSSPSFHQHSLLTPNLLDFPFSPNSLHLFFLALLSSPDHSFLLPPPLSLFLFQPLSLTVSSDPSLLSPHKALLSFLPHLFFSFAALLGYGQCDQVSFINPITNCCTFITFDEVPDPGDLNIRFLTLRNDCMNPKLSGNYCSSNAAFRAFYELI